MRRKRRKDLNIGKGTLGQTLLFLDQYENDDIWRGTGDEGFFYDLFGKTSILVNDIPMANSQQMVRVDTH